MVHQMVFTKQFSDSSDFGIRNDLLSELTIIHTS